LRLNSCKAVEIWPSNALRHFGFTSVEARQLLANEIRMFAHDRRQRIGPDPPDLVVSARKLNHLLDKPPAARGIKIGLRQLQNPIVVPVAA
jgi:hypothetical protein